MKRLEKLAPDEARKVLTLAALTVRAAAKPPEIAAIVDLGGAKPATLTDIELRAVAHLLLHRKCDGVANADEGPLRVRLDELEGHELVCDAKALLVGA
jgi:hypothetical protein